MLSTTSFYSLLLAYKYYPNLSLRTKLSCYKFFMLHPFYYHRNGVMTSENNVLSKIPLKGLYSILVSRYILNQNGRHGCLLAYTSKKLTSADQAKLQFIYKVLTPYLPFSAHLFCRVRGGMRAKGELNLFIPEYLGLKYYGLLGCMGGELDVLLSCSHTIFWACTLHHKLDFKDLTKFTSKSTQIQSPLN